MGVAENGQQAVEFLQQGSFDVVLMSVEMPIMDGLTATAAIRELGTPTMRLPIIAMTAHALKGDAEHYVSAGMDAYIIKPSHANELIELVERLAGTAYVAEGAKSSAV